jgi:prephenate dehydratase
MTRVSFQGIAGAYSEEAVRQFFGGQVEPVPCHAFKDLFVAVEQGDVDYGMLPVENSTAGSVVHSYELLMEHDLRVRAEVIFRVQHMLMAAPGTQLGDLKRIKSHPQALAQCERYLARRKMVPVPAFDTAGSARDLAETPEPETGAIASALAAELYGLEILEPGIEDSRFNYTRFFVLGLDDPPRSQRSKTSLVFTTRHQPGALYDSLGEFAQRHINLTKIESRPRRNRPWQYLFYLDFDGHWQDPECEAALMGLLRRSSFVKLLGSYPSAMTPYEDAAS